MFYLSILCLELFESYMISKILKSGQDKSLQSAAWITMQPTELQKKCFLSSNISVNILTIETCMGNLKYNNITQALIAH